MSREEEEMCSNHNEGWVYVHIHHALSAKLSTLSKYDNQAHLKSLSGLWSDHIYNIYYICVFAYGIYIYTHIAYTCMPMSVVFYLYMCRHACTLCTGCVYMYKFTYIYVMTNYD